MLVTVARFALSLFYGAAGILHLIDPDAFLPIMPSFVPWPREVVVLTGLCEIAGSVGLLTARFRRAAGLSLALYALCVWPANFKHAFDGVDVGSLPTGWWYHGPRLAFQPVLMVWALWVSNWFRGKAISPAP